MLIEFDKGEIAVLKSQTSPDMVGDICKYGLEERKFITNKRIMAAMMDAAVESDKKFPNINSLYNFMKKRGAKFSKQAFIYKISPPNQVSWRKDGFNSDLNDLARRLLVPGYFEKSITSVAEKILCALEKIPPETKTTYAELARMLRDLDPRIRRGVAEYHINPNNRHHGHKLNVIEAAKKFINNNLPAADRIFAALEKIPPDTKTTYGGLARMLHAIDPEIHTHVAKYYTNPNYKHSRRELVEAAKRFINNNLSTADRISAALGKIPPDTKTTCRGVARMLHEIDPMINVLVAEYYVNPNATQSKPKLAEAAKKFF
ncbi:MAG: hypothetical protein LBD94_03215, partial [Rickettsiales bacterium]|nr:hypothetical protein [Rickettsiales bacterium]